MIFSGTGIATTQLDSEQEMIDKIADNSGRQITRQDWDIYGLQLSFRF